MKVRGCLGHSDHEIVQFSVLEEVGRKVSITATLDSWRADFDLLRNLVDRVDNP